MLLSIVIKLYIVLSPFSKLLHKKREKKGLGMFCFDE